MGSNVQSYPIKSVHITNYYHRDSGGISVAYNKLLEHAERHKRFVRLIVPGPKNATEIVNDYSKIYYLKSGFSPVFDRRYRIMMPWKSYFLDKSPIKTILREEQPDIIEIGEKYTLSLMAGLLRKGIMNISDPRPMLVHFSCERMDDNVGSFISRGKIAKRFSRAYVRNYIFPMFDFHIANSNYTASELIDSVSDVSNGGRSQVLLRRCWNILRAAKVSPEARVFVNHCGVDNETFSASRKSEQVRMQMLAKYDVSPNAKLLLYAGRLSPEKNIALLPETMKELVMDLDREFHLLVAGDGPKAEWLVREFNSCSSAVTFLGNISSRNEMADIFANCDAFVHPNPSEPFGIAPLEAMSSGLPLVAPRSGGLLSYADDNNAWLSAATSVAFSKSIRSIFEDVDKTRQRIETALATASRFTWTNSVDRVFALYDTMHAKFLHSRELFDYHQSERRADFARDLRIDVPQGSSDLKA